MTDQPNANGEPAPGFDVARARFVLVEPQTAGNVGAAARALKNLGFSALVVVRPQCDLRSRPARMMAVDAVDLLLAAEVHDDLDSALGGARSVVGTSRRTGKYRRPHYRLDAFSAELLRMASSGELAVVFGREDSGLTDRELDRCTHLVHLPTSAAYPSLNLAQCVLLVAYELHRSVLGSQPDEPVDPPARHDAREAMYLHVERMLFATGFLSDETAETMMRRLRRLLGRAGATTEEVQMLRGIARQTLWAVDAREAADDGAPSARERSDER